jgi:predicted RNase H-like HicB family nuclease
MRYTVFLKQEQGQYSAVVPWLPACSAQGKTREEALQKLKQMIEGTLADMEITSLEVDIPDQSTSGNPWFDTAGMFADDPLFDKMLSEVMSDR